jgi:exodeoxyribonuclease VII large subunit
VDIFSDKRILSVSQLTNLVTGVLEENFDHVWVEGEISNLSTPTSGHIYFTLKDSSSQIRAVMFRASARILKFKVSDGMHLIVRGRVSVFAQRGEYQLIAEYLEPKGLGALQLAFIQLKERLFKEGLFDESQKKPIPRLPKVVGVVTSPTGAAIHDILNVLERRFSNIHVLLNPVKVQGEGAAEEVASAIRDFNRYGNVDVLIIGRGGGSIEDLWAFNEEVVARAINKSKIPIISAVGHEVDITISDLAADLRAPTPSAAAELVIASKSELSETLAVQISRLNRAMNLKLNETRGKFLQLFNGLRGPSSQIQNLSQRYDYLQERFIGCTTTIIELHKRQLESFDGRLTSKNPRIIVEMYKEQLASLQSRQERAVTGRLERLKDSVGLHSTALQKLSPLATLGRGYSLTYRSSDGVLITDSGQINTGDRVDLYFAHGRAKCTVEQTSTGAS